MTKFSMEKFSNESKTAVANYKKRIAKAKERFAMFDVNPAEEIALATEELEAEQARIKETFEAELSSAITDAKQKVVASTAISSVEYASIAGFVSMIETQLLVGGNSAAIEMMQTYRDQLTDRQANALWNAVAPKMVGAEPSELRHAHSIMANGSSELLESVKQLEALKLESPDMEILNFQLAQKTAKRPEVGRTTDFVPMERD